jgi:DNA-binding LytR/AlgR family response regulator
MRVVIIEDERPAVRKLVRLLNELDHSVQVAVILQSVEASVNWFRNNPLPDLIFMDVQLEDGLCFDIFENVDISVPVIFTTAYDKYALKAFKVNSVDYLLKPIDQQDLRNALNKFKKVHQNAGNLVRIESVMQQLKPRTKERFLVKVGDHYRSIQVTGINCFFIEERCTFLNTGEGKSYAIDYSLEKVEQMLDPLYFFRINRNFIINFSSIMDIVSYSSSRLKLNIHGWTEAAPILVSRERVSDFKAWMDR